MINPKQKICTKITDINYRTRSPMPDPQPDSFCLQKNKTGLATSVSSV
jgi:hypothetical protein